MTDTHIIDLGYHVDHCDWCHGHPFDLCAIGRALAFQGTDSRIDSAGLTPEKFWRVDGVAADKYETLRASLIAIGYEPHRTVWIEVNRDLFSGTERIVIVISCASRT